MKLIPTVMLGFLANFQLSQAQSQMRPLATVNGLDCGPGMKFADFQFQCDFSLTKFQLIVASPRQVGFPDRSGCTRASTVNGGGAGGCSFCDEDHTQSTKRTLIWRTETSTCSSGAIARQMYPEVENLIESDGYNLCTDFDFDDNDGGDYITEELASKFESLLIDNLCVVDPTESPSASPSLQPSEAPTEYHSAAPSTMPSSSPSSQPTRPGVILNLRDATSGSAKWADSMCSSLLVTVIMALWYIR